MTNIKELDAVALTCDLPEHGLMRGDVGTAVLVHGKGEAFEVEFVGYDGQTIALLTRLGAIRLDNAQRRRTPPTAVRPS